MEFLDCHEEKITRCGLIQDLGFLFVFSNETCCIAVSENVIQLTQTPFEQYLGLPIDRILAELTGSSTLVFEDIDESFKNSIFYRFTKRIVIHNENYDLSIYRHNDHIYVEVEIYSDIQVESNKLYYYAKYLEDHKAHIWESLATQIRQIIHYDRVMVYQFMEDHSGQVIAESKSEDMHSLLGYRYPEFDIPKQARELYTIFLARHTADTDAATHKIMGSSQEDIDLSKCSIRALSPIHIQYIKNSKARASASFSIIRDGQLWGLVTCQNNQPQHVDLSQRHLCTFLTQFATKHHISELLKKEMEIQSAMNVVEKDLKSDLLIDRNTFHVLERFGEKIMPMLHADGIYIKYATGERSIGLVPNTEQLQEINDFVQDDDSIFSTHKFKYSYQGENILPGVITTEILPNSQWKIYIFRKEVVIQEVWAGKPEKHLQYDDSKKITFPSPRTSFEAWKQITRTHATPWLQVEISFIERIVFIIQQALAKRNAEIDQLNKDLVRSNNALDTFTYTLTHDIKNPLSSIKLGSQMILMKKNITTEQLHKLANNMLDSSSLISDMLDKVHELSKSNSVALNLELLDPTSKIILIAESSKNQYDVTHLDFVLGAILPIKGERTLIYQLFLNIVGNAIKYSSKQEKPKVEVYSTASDNKVTYFIIDNGIGMDLKNGNNIFEIFQRLPNSSGYEGSGIGLSIVRRIIDRLGAEIKVESSLGKGTTIQIQFDN
ncbi:ATP-binding protein [Sphingobacterium faecium]|jgi:chemotaxis family two-component system sensor kinase Cph1|uniref:ATP-binding protein n=1 Tax=Sphingobacterium faecium TaxID=34087 RepID=UPI0004E5EFAE|nr:ATP-binding protein [Sphingobacterium faecium]WGQ14979.1 ATP-binding protein [Sphingobacterium faecium]CDS94573.1 putative histidine kinase [Sphingobacterium sp. PM2-P1-29]SJN49323.1 Phytochrome, two-component sensor histidine kinase [Sphingobacterium faecium PCAi_F2.5]